MRAKRVTPFFPIKVTNIFTPFQTYQKKVAEQLEILIILLMKKGSGKPCLFCQKLCLCRHFWAYIYTSTTTLCCKKKGSKDVLSQQKEDKIQLSFVIVIRFFVVIFNHCELHICSFCQVMCNRDK